GVVAATTRRTRRRGRTRPPDPRPAGRVAQRLPGRPGRLVRGPRGGNHPGYDGDLRLPVRLRRLGHVTGSRRVGPARAGDRPLGHVRSGQLSSAAIWANSTAIRSDSALAAESGRTMTLKSSIRPSGSTWIMSTPLMARPSTVAVNSSTEF